MRLTTREVEAILRSGEVIVPLKEDADILFQSGYGTLREDKSGVLSRCETLYLVAEKRVKFLERAKGAEVTFQSLLERFRIEDPKIWTRYLIFLDLRSRGYVVKEGVGRGIDFRVYARGTYHVKAAKYVVFAVCEGNPIPANMLSEVLWMVQGMKKELIVAVADRRGEIVYYSLSWLNLGLRLRNTE